MINTSATRLLRLSKAVNAAIDLINLSLDIIARGDEDRLEELTARQVRRLNKLNAICEKDESRE